MFEDFTTNVTRFLFDAYWFETLCSDDKLVYLYLAVSGNKDLETEFLVSPKKISFYTSLSLKRVIKSIESLHDKGIIKNDDDMITINFLG